MIQHEMIDNRKIIAKQSLKSKEKSRQRLHVINKYTQVLI